ncbi:hypothetical protein M8013_05700 [Enterobacteriaceae bacterium H4N4]|uniref:Uncharacterized protein n=1 Tax=Silvania confinis TaxID=2926470 RepID=A0A9J6QDC9_9ENTR|nr:hypothetical protein [Silvania confinis]MCU6668251.1 hypothetical protein [Silvania confinis]
MPNYCFYKKDKQIVVLEKSEEHEAFHLIKQGYEKQFEEVSSSNKENALTRFADIRRNNRVDHSNFLAGAGAMPLIGVLTAVAVFLFRKKRPRH